MITLSVDVGNTRIKVGVFQNDELIKVDIFSTQQLLSIPENYAYEFAIISSVGVATLPVFVSQAFGKKKLFLLNYQTPLPFVNGYQTPKTLGADRVAAVAGAFSLYPKKNVLVVDAGSCITYDFIDRDARYHGGNISPGVQMRLRAMHTFTAKLPLVNLNTINKGTHEIPLIGTHTETALLSGAFKGTVAEITQMIRMYSDKFADLQIVLCGGDTALLAHEMPRYIRIIPDLVLIGLNNILYYTLNNSVDWQATLHGRIN